MLELRCDNFIEDFFEFWTVCGINFGLLFVKVKHQDKIMKEGSKLTLKANEWNNNMHS